MTTARISSRSSPTIGQMIGGRYSLHSQVSDSPTLWIAQDEIEDRLVIVRVLPRELQQDPRAFEELQRQVGMCRELNHPHIAGVLELVVEPDAPAFLVTEEAEGKSLDLQLRENRDKVFTWEWLEPKVQQLCEAIKHGHSRNVIHGAIQPENIVINRLGDVKLLNFGTGAVLGNPLYSGLANRRHLAYLSPQLLEGHTPSPSDDVYAFGATLYACLCGAPPFGGGELLSQIRSATPASLETRLQERVIVNPVPSAVTRFIMDALAKSPEARPRDVSDVLRPEPNVAMVRNSEPIGAPADGRPEETACPLRIVGLSAREQELEVQPSLLPAPIADVTVSETEVLVEGRVLKRARRERKRPAPLVAGLLVLLLLVAVASVGWVAYGRHLKQKGASETDLTTRPGTEQTAPKAAAAPPAQPAESEQGFEKLFTGKDLNGWTGDAKYWSVKDGSIIGMARSDAPLKSHKYLLCDKGPVQDFELRFSFRCIAFQNNELPNAGVEYRARNVSRSLMRGYQYEIVRDGKEVGALMDDQGRRRLAGLGARVQAAREADKDVLQTVGAVTPAEQAANLYRKDDWNQGAIIAKGNRLVHKLNDKVVAEVVDDNAAKRHEEGLIAFEIYLRNTNNPATFVQFKDVRMKKL